MPLTSRLRCTRPSLRAGDPMKGPVRQLRAVLALWDPGWEVVGNPRCWSFDAAVLPGFRLASLACPWPGRQEALGLAGQLAEACPLAFLSHRLQRGWQALSAG